jgi:hypothetical protein
VGLGLPTDLPVEVLEVDPEHPLLAGPEPVLASVEILETIRKRDFPPNASYRYLGKLLSFT